MIRARIWPVVEYCLPAWAIGAIAALGAGGLAAAAGLPGGWAVITGLALGVPIAIIGAAYAMLMVTGTVPTGVFTTAALFWLVGFPMARLVHESTTELLFTGSLGLPEDPLGFLAYQAVLSMGFAIGYLWLHEQIGRLWWPRVRDRNAYAHQCVEQHKQSAVAMHEYKEATKRGRQGRRRRAALAREATASSRRT